ncbi:MAG: B12-binding domain-containing radical SAM protein [Planctomycetes bacterium]|nr:B12-binding domain-containing radical SAM protein [Planctomycetota bacterium]
MSDPKKTIALVNVINPSSEEKLRIPVGLIYLGSALQKHGYNVKLYQPIQKQKEIQEVEHKIIEANPLFVGFSVFMGPGSVEGLDMSERIKNALGTKIVWGGKFPTSISEQAIKEDCIDVVCLGEGERTIVELAKAFEDGSGLEEVKGICYEADGQAVYTEPRELIDDLDTLDYDLNLIQDWDRYITKLNGRPALLDVIESQRGCPFHCRFCYQSRKGYHKDSKKVVRAHSVEWVFEKAKQLKEMIGVDYTSFCDDEFWIKRERSFEIIEKLYKIGLKFFKLRMRFSSLKDEEMIERLIANEIYTLNFGLESGVDRILKLMDKRQTTEQILEKMRLLAKYPQITAGAPVIIGSPTETKEEVLESIRFALRLCEVNPNFDFGINLYKPLPGTDFFDMAVDLGFDPPKDIRSWSSVEHKLVYKLAKSWLPWFDKREELNYNRVFDYLRILYHVRKHDRLNSKRRGFGKLNPINILRNIFGIIAYKRIYHWFFLFPIEIYFSGIYKYFKRFRS